MLRFARLLSYVSVLYEPSVILLECSPTDLNPGASPFVKNVTSGDSAKAQSDIPALSDCAL